MPDIGAAPAVDPLGAPDATPLTPEAVTRLHRELWAARGGTIGRSFDVPSCPYHASELEALHGRGIRVGYLPAELATQRDRHLLAAIFPAMRSYSANVDNVVTNDDDPYGWFEYETARHCPFLDTTEEVLLRDVEAQRRVLLNLNQYIVASQDSKRLTGHHLDDDGTWVRLSSRVDGRIVSARCDGHDQVTTLGPAYIGGVDGSLLVGYDLSPDDFGPTHGARTTPLAGRQVRRDGPPGPTSLRRHPDLSRRLSAVDLEVERQRQISLLTDCGYHRELGLDVEEYVRSLPTFPAKATSFEGRFDVPLLVDGRIPWTRQARLTGTRYVERVADYEPIDTRSLMPPAAYAGWFSDWATRFPDPIAPVDARAALGADEVGGNLVELIMMTLAHPDLVPSGRFLEAIGYQLPYVAPYPGLTFEGVLRTPCMYYWRGAPEIGANLSPRAFAIFRPLVRSVSIVLR